MSDLIERDELRKDFCNMCEAMQPEMIDCTKKGCMSMQIIDEQPTIEAEPVRHGRWIECDYKHLEHGFIETEPNAGLCCSECRTGFKKNHMTYKAFCPACGAKMDGGAENDT